MAIQPPAFPRRMRAGIALACLALLVVLIAGCGREAAVQANQGTAAKASSIPSVATAYASVVDLTLQTTVKEGALLLEQMKTQPPSSLAKLCSDAGVQYSYQYNAFRQTYTPPYARSAQARAVTGYKLALSAMDECGNAADSNDSHAMKIAAGDFYTALSKVAGAERTISQWMSAPH